MQHFKKSHTHTSIYKCLANYIIHKVPSNVHILSESVNSHLLILWLPLLHLDEHREIILPHLVCISMTTRQIFFPSHQFRSMKSIQTYRNGYCGFGNYPKSGLKLPCRLYFRHVSHAAFSF